MPGRRGKDFLPINNNRVLEFGSGIGVTSNYAGSYRGQRTEVTTITATPTAPTNFDFWRSGAGATTLPDGTNDLTENIRRNGSVGLNIDPTSTLHVQGSIAETVTIITATTTLNATHDKIVLNNAAANITITLPNALTCLGRKYEFSRYAGSTGTVTIVGGAGNQIQARAGTVGATTTIGIHGATGQGLNHSFTAVSVGGVGIWVRL